MTLIFRGDLQSPMTQRINEPRMPSVARRIHSTIRFTLLPTLLIASVLPALGQTFQLPTANRALFEAGAEEKFYAGTAGNDWASGGFGCVRTSGNQFHEGLDIRCLSRDRRGEPNDPVMATTDGTVVYINSTSALSNYGKYIVVKHQVEGLEVYSNYAHLSEVREGLKAGQTVKAGERIATMGRTTNTRQSITKDRAHVHFELNLLLNERFAQWVKSRRPDQRNDHGDWNGQNMAGMDPRLILTGQNSQKAGFSIVQFVRSQTELCRILVRGKEISFARRYPALVRANPLTDKEGIGGYEIAINYSGLPFQLTPRAPSELKGRANTQLLSVNEAERTARPCGKFVVKRSGKWELTAKGMDLADLLSF
jgi:murein DD-endopeptidase MepM/ murein hydrolase activator NlpD